MSKNQTCRLSMRISQWWIDIKKSKIKKYVNNKTEKKTTKSFTFFTHTEICKTCGKLSFYYFMILIFRAIIYWIVFFRIELFRTCGSFRYIIYDIAIETFNQRTVHYFLSKEVFIRPNLSTDSKRITKQ